MKKQHLIRPAKRDEAAVLSDIAFRSKAYWGYSDDFMTACLDELTYSADEIEQHPFYLCEVEDKVAGFYALYPFEETAVLELEALFVDPTFIGHGVGRQLMAHATQTARALGAAQLIIQSDPNAAPFYAKMGGVLSGKRPSASIANRVLPIYRITLN